MRRNFCGSFEANCAHHDWGTDLLIPALCVLWLMASSSHFLHFPKSSFTLEWRAFQVLAGPFHCSKAKIKGWYIFISFQDGRENREDCRKKVVTGYVRLSPVRWQRWTRLFLSHLRMESEDVVYTNTSKKYINKLQSLYAPTCYTEAFTGLKWSLRQLRLLFPALHHC